MLSKKYKFSTLRVSVQSENVYHVELNRPGKRNAMNSDFWSEIVDCFTKLSSDENCRVVVISGNGAGFSAGLDLTSVNASYFMGSEDIGRKAFQIRNMLMQYQQSFSVIEKCPKPVISAVHGFCIGGGVALISACDIRYATSDAYFMIKEVDIGLQADLGTLQRLPKMIANDSIFRELAFTGNRFNADDALKMGLISQVFEDKTKMLASAFELAKFIANKSPIAVQGTKINLNYSRDHTVEEGLEFAANWNMSMLQSEDVIQSLISSMGKSKKPVKFSKL